MVLPSVIKCPVTRVEHKFVDEKTNYDDFKEYLINKKIELDSKERINFVLHFEGINLGAASNSLSLFCIAECLNNEIFFEKIKQGEIKPVNLQPGYMVKIPIGDEILDLISSILCHPHAKLIIFDCANPLVALLYKKIRIEYDNILDPQIENDDLEGKDYFTTIGSGGKTIKHLSRKDIIKNEGKIISCKEQLKAFDELLKKNTVNFNELNYKLRDCEDPFPYLVNEDLLNRAAAALCSNAVIAVIRFHHINEITLANATQKKIDYFCQLVNDYGISAPFSIKQFAFIPQSFEHEEKLKSDLNENYRTWLYCKIVLDNQDLYTKSSNPDTPSLDKIHAYYQKCFEFIEANKDKPYIQNQPSYSKQKPKKHRGRGRGKRY